MSRKKESNDSPLEGDDDLDALIEAHLKSHAKQSKPLKGPRHQYTTGLVTMDYFINPRNPGIPGGSIIEFAGEGNSGKTAHTLNICKYHMAQGYKVTYIDQENGLKDEYLEGWGWGKYTHPELFSYIPAVEPEEIHLQYDFSYELLKNLKGKVKPHIVVIDSLPYMLPKPNFESPRVGGNIQFLNQWLRSIRVLMDNSNALVILINSVYEDNKNQYNDYIVSLGKELGRVTDVRCINYKRTNPSNAGTYENHSFEFSKNLNVTTRQKLGVKIWKNKFTNSNPKFSQLDHFLNTDNRFGEFGLDNANSMLMFLKSMGILRSTGATYTMDGISMYWRKWEESINTDEEINRTVLNKTIETLNNVFNNKLDMEN